MQDDTQCTTQCITQCTTQCITQCITQCTTRQCTMSRTRAGEDIERGAFLLDYAGFVSITLGDEHDTNK